MRQLITLCFLAAAWLLWSGIYTPLLLAFGAFSCALVVYLAHRMNFFHADVFSLHLAPRLPAYWLWLLRELVTSNLQVARIVLSPRIQVSPVLVNIHAKSLSPVGLAILGNSITLTPGTLTLDANDGQLQVHCLTQANADELAAGEMQRRVARLMAMAES